MIVVSIFVILISHHVGIYYCSHLHAVYLLVMLSKYAAVARLVYPTPTMQIPAHTEWQ
jgi:hypothetical protein